MVRFQNVCKNNLSSNQLTVVTAHDILVEEEPEVSKRGTIDVSMFCYSLKRRTNFTIRRIRRNWRMILMMSRSMTLISMTRGSVTGEKNSRTMEEVWTRRHFYMLIVEIYISKRRKV